MIGWIKIHRKLLEWEWYSEPNTFRLFIHLLLKANHKVNSHKGIKVEKGEIMTGLNLLEQQTGLSIQKIRTALKHLKSTNEITIKTSNQGTIIQIVKYKDYQIVTSEPTNDQQTGNKRPTTNKNKKNVKTINNRMEEFKNSLQPFLEKYGNEMLNDFYMHWTEKRELGRKMKFEMQQTWDFSRRLQRWFKNDYGNKSTFKKPPTAEDNLEKELKNFKQT